MKNIQPSSPVLLRHVHVLDPIMQVDQVGDLWIGSDGIGLDPISLPPDTHMVDARGMMAMPGLIDMHVHLREPGQTHKETWATGSAAALAGGVTTVVVMPNTSPAIDTPERVAAQIKGMREARGVDILVAAAATMGLGGMENTHASSLQTAGAIALTDDGKPVLDDAVMLRALQQCQANGLVMMQHAEDTRLSCHAPVHAGKASQALHLPGQPGIAEYALVERDIALVRQTGARYHVLHVSTAETVALVRAARKEGLPVTCEVTPHHLVLTEEACLEGDPNTKMNPPLRTQADQQALLEGLMDGSIQAVASDHAPHAADEKARGMCHAPFGVVGLETAFSVLYGLVHAGMLSPLQAVALMTQGPARILGLKEQEYSLLHSDTRRHVTLFDPHRQWSVNAQTLKGRSHNSAFFKRRLTGQVVATFLNGSLRYAVQEESA